MKPLSFSRYAASLLLALFLLAALGCAASTTAMPESGSLASPQALLHQLPSRTTSSAVLSLAGADCELNQRLSVEGTAAVFAPDCPGEDAPFASVAYGVYRLNAAGYCGLRQLELAWSEVPAGGCWIGLSDWGNDRWVWQEAAAAVQLAGAGLAAYANGEGEVLVAVLLQGSQACTLQSVEVDPGPVDPWPMFGHDAQHTHRSQHVGSQTGALLWAYDTGAEIRTAPAVDAAGTVYCGNGDGLACALNPDGTLAWSSHAGWGYLSSPAVAADGKVYCGNLDGYLSALDPAGVELWSYYFGLQIWSSPAITADGTIYIAGSDYNVYAFNPDGSVSWSYNTHAFPTNSVAVGLDGMVYGKNTNKLLAINPGGTLAWEYWTNKDFDSSPAIGPDGAIYFGSGDGDLGVIFALNSDGTLRWSYPTGAIVNSSPALGLDGAVYVGCNDGKLYALNADGSLRWQFTLAGAGYSSPALDAEGTVYIGSMDLDAVSGAFNAINSDGSLKWSYPTGAVFSSPAIGPQGTVYVGGMDGKLYAFGD